ncbi:MAG TPA: class I SAM-dependent methyltransferase [Dehalococcoidia bacterium]|nr:class I SAM-dependent methyltransferase [Dehalococcoidia bacterium]
MSTSGTSKTEQYKEAVRQDWTEGAAAWRKWNAQFVIQSRAATETIVQAAQLKPGMRVLDLASGSGEPALTVAAAVGPDGRVTATDLVPQMLAVAEDIAKQRGLINSDFQPADAEALPFPDQTFDAVTCRFGVMFFPNVVQGLREVRRVLKPDGRATFLAWGPLDQNPAFFTALGPFIKRANLPPPDPDAPNPLRFAQAGSLSAAMEEARFRHVTEEQRTIAWPYPGPPEEAWESLREVGAPAFGRLMKAVPAEQLDVVIGEVVAGIRHYYDGQRVNFPATVVLVSGTR